MFKKLYVVFFAAFAMAAAFGPGSASAANGGYQPPNPSVQTSPKVDHVSTQTVRIGTAVFNGEDLATGQVTILSDVMLVAGTQISSPKCFTTKGGFWNSGHSSSDLRWFWDSTPGTLCPNANSPTKWVKVSGGTTGRRCYNPARVGGPPPGPVAKGRIIMVRSFASVRMHLRAHEIFRVTAVCGFAQGEATAETWVNLSMAFRSRGAVISRFFASVQARAWAKARAKIKCIPLPQVPPAKPAGKIHVRVQKSTPNWPHSARFGYWVTINGVRLKKPVKVMNDKSPHDVAVVDKGTTVCAAEIQSPRFINDNSIGPISRCVKADANRVLRYRNWRVAPIWASKTTKANGAVCFNVPVCPSDTFPIVGSWGGKMGVLNDSKPVFMGLQPIGRKYNATETDAKGYTPDVATISFVLTDSGITLAFVNQKTTTTPPPPGPGPTAAVTHGCSVSSMTEKDGRLVRLSVSSPDGSPSSTSVNWGDGVTEGTTSHTYGSDGSWNISVTLSFSSGNPALCSTTATTKAPTSVTQPNPPGVPPVAGPSPPDTGTPAAGGTPSASGPVNPDGSTPGGGVSPCPPGWKDDGTGTGCVPA